jgi:hypothetical protein
MKKPSPKEDMLRQMREQNYERSHAAEKRKQVPALRAAISAVPVKRAPKVKLEVKP